MPRPTVFTKEVLQKLEEAFALGCSDKESCLFADIAPASLYNYQVKHPEFLERKELLHEKPVLQARKVLVDAVKKDPRLALQYLERKKKAEFGRDNKARYITDESHSIGEISAMMRKFLGGESKTS